MRRYRRCLPAALLAAVVVCGCSPVESPDLFPEYSADKALPPPVKQSVAVDANRQVFWGDLHIHTSLSSDAYTMGVRALPDDAYTFAKGGEIAHGAGYGIRLKKPLDFAAVTDHSEYLGVLRGTQSENALTQRSLRDRLLNDGPLHYTFTFMRSAGRFSLRDIDSSIAADHSETAWAQIIAAAERHNDPGRFTTFVGYEWSSMPDNFNLHRNVIYRSAAVPEMPYSSLQSNDPRDLWSALEAQREKGMESVAIPHNGNVSGGKMYGSLRFDGTPMTAEYARRRLLNEPLTEIFQVKGSSETHPKLSPDDALAGFEIYDTLLDPRGGHSEPQGSYARDALRLGLELAHSNNLNPYRFGVIGASDGHNASSPVEEDNYHGKLPMLDGSASIRLRTASYLPADTPGGVLWSAAGLAGVWATENTRAALFDAMRRKETYATTGPRMVVRFFAGWNYPPDMLQHDNWIERAQDSGVPMGGTLGPKSKAAPFTIAVWAARDVASAKLDRIQIVKGWTDDAGASHEKIIDVAWAGAREKTANGHLPAVGNTVDLASASYTNTIGAEQLQAVWTDPDFEPLQNAFYYARVIEIPTPRWSTFDAKALGIAASKPGSLQERAVTSAIWYEATQ